MSNRLISSLGATLGRLNGARAYTSFSPSLSAAYDSSNQSSEPGPSNYLSSSSTSHPSSSQEEPALTLQDYIEAAEIWLADIDRLHAARNANKKLTGKTKRMVTRETYQLTPDERLSLRNIDDLINKPKMSWERTRSQALHNQLWTAYHNLSERARDELPLPVHQRILRMIVPGKEAILADQVAKFDTYDSSPWALTNLTKYPYENRLRFVISSIRERSARLSAKRSLPEMTVAGPPQPHKIELQDYLFVLKQFSYTGYIDKMEEVVTEALLHNFPASSSLLDFRLATMARWVSLRSRVRLRETAFRNRTDSHLAHIQARPIKEFTHDHKIAAQTARLLKSMMKELEDNADVGFRRRTFDMLLRVATESGNESAFEDILRAGYGIDLRFPGMVLDEKSGLTLPRSKSPSSATTKKNLFTPNRHFPSTPVTRRVPLSVYAMNTILRHLGEEGKGWQLLSVMEALGVKDAELADAGLGRAREAEAAGVEQDLEVDVMVQNSTLEDVEEEPITLSAAMAKEEASGDRIGILGFPAEPKSAYSYTEEGVAETYPEKVTPHAPRPWSDFLTPLPTVQELVASISSAPSPDISIGARTLVLSATPLNSTSYAILLHSASTAIRAAIKAEDTEVAENGVMLALHSARSLFREARVRRNEFLRDWIGIRLEAEGRVAAVEAGAGLDEVVKQEKLKEIKEWRSKARSVLLPPLVTMDGEMLKPLFVAIGEYEVMRNASARELRRELLEEITADLQDQKDEFEVLVGRTYEDDKGRTTWGGDNVNIRSIDSGVPSARQRQFLGSLVSDETVENGKEEKEDNAFAGDDGEWTISDDGESRWTAALRFSLSSHTALLRARISALGGLVEREETRDRKERERIMDKRKDRKYRYRNPEGRHTGKGGSNLTL